MAPSLPLDEIERLVMEVRELRAIKRGLVADLDQVLKLLEDMRSRAG